MVRPPGSLRDHRSLPLTVRGRAEILEFESAVLGGNPLGDPARRAVAVCRPRSGSSEGRPLLLFLPGFTGTGWAELGGERPFQETVFQVYDRLVRTEGLAEVVLASPDASTALGGSQYVNSSATGRYADYVVRELLPWLQDRYRTRSVGVFGQSSGGFGALHLAMEFPGTFAAVGSSAGDMGFEYCYGPDFPKAVRAFRAKGGPEGFLRFFSEHAGEVARSYLSPEGAALDVLAMASCYSPSPDRPGEFDLPFDPETAEILPEIWDRWLAFDPVRRLRTEKGAQALRRPNALHIAASTADEFALDAGARMFLRAAGQLRVPVTYSEHEGNHFDRTPRFEAILRALLPALSADSPDPGADR